MAESMAEVKYDEFEKLENGMAEIEKLMTAMRFFRSPSRDNDNQKLCQKALKICRQKSILRGKK
jgi:hypothetical protein